MKFLKPYLLLLSILFAAVSLQSCKDECKDVICQNGGICNEGICSCPEGFQGENCETVDLCFGIICENEGICESGNCDCAEGYIGTNCETYDVTKIQILLDNGETPHELIDGNIPIDSLYGKIYKEGLIFYINTLDTSGLVAAFEDQSVAQEWGCFEDIPGAINVGSYFDEVETAQGARIGDGAANTNAIVAYECDEDTTAATLCRDKGEDWFLPSRGELNQMYGRLHIQGYGDFGIDNAYWSSTEKNPLQAWAMIFSDGEQFLKIKNNSLRVRAVRAF